MVQGKGNKNAYLSSRARLDVFRILIGSYRWRVKTDRLGGVDHGIHYKGNLEEGLLWTRGDAADDFQQYLDLAEEAGILPEWWQFEDRMKCLEQAIDPDDSQNIFQAINDRDHAPQFPNDFGLRSAMYILAELVFGWDGHGRQDTEEWYEYFVKQVQPTPERIVSVADDLMRRLRWSVPPEVLVNLARTRMQHGGW